MVILVIKLASCHIFYYIFNMSLGIYRINEELIILKETPVVCEIGAHFDRITYV